MALSQLVADPDSSVLQDPAAVAVLRQPTVRAGCSGTSGLGSCTSVRTQAALSPKTARTALNGEGEVRTRRGGARGVGGGSDSALFPTTSVPVWLSVALASCHTLVVDS